MFEAFLVSMSLSGLAIRIYKVTFCVESGGSGTSRRGYIGGDGG